MSEQLHPSAFRTERAEVRDGVEIAYARAGVGGYPLLLVHGWPESRRIWWRNIGPLADAGFEVIAPDLRGLRRLEPGTRRLLRPGGALARHAGSSGRRPRAPRCAAAGGDLGGGVVQDLGLRFPGLIERQILFNCVLPLLPAAYEAAGLPAAPTAELRAAGDYFARQGREADALAGNLGTPSGAGATWPSSTGTACGRRPAPSPALRSTS